MSHASDDARIYFYLSFLRFGYLAIMIYLFMSSLSWSIIFSLIVFERLLLSTIGFCGGVYVRTGITAAITMIVTIIISTTQTHTAATESNRNKFRGYSNTTAIFLLRIHEFET